MQKSWIALSFIAAMFLACGSDSSSGADSSDEITEVSDDKLSDSNDNPKSSSSVSRDSDSSESKKGSSSSKKTNSSSSVKPESSASKGSSSSAEPESSASKESSSSVEPESSSVEESSSSAEPESSASKESSSSVEPESSSVEESSSSVKPESSASEESSSSVEPVSSSVEESSSSAESEPRDASIYNADANTRNGKVYKTTTIVIVDDERGIDYSEVWMAENLNYVTDNSYCYGDEPEKCTTYGRLYTWAAAVGKSESECGFGQVCNLPAGEDIRGICPEGWHLPSEGEWNALTGAVSNNVAVKLRSTSGWNRAGTDIYSFSALSAGFRNNDGTFSYEGEGAAFWSSTESDGDLAYTMLVGDAYTYTVVADLSKLRGHSIRCLKD